MDSIIRLQVALAHSGVASRRKSAQLIEEGKVKVNGVIVKEKGHKVNPAIDRIEVNGKPIKYETKIYLMLNKPKGVITTSSDEKKRKNVMDLIKIKGSRVYPVGRLDKDSEGLLLLTNDGDLAYKLTHPRFGIKKIYIVEAKGHLNTEDVKKLEKGIYIEGQKTLPCKISVLKSTSEKTALKIELHEGRKRQIRRMVENIGSSVISLKRIEYGDLSLSGLNAGEYRFLTDGEIKKIKG